jgi:phosphate/sulfate permease
MQTPGTPEMPPAWKWILFGLALAAGTVIGGYFFINGLIGLAQ